MKKVIITMIVEDNIKEKDIDLLIDLGLTHTLINATNVEIDIEETKD